MPFIRPRVWLAAVLGISGDARRARFFHCAPRDARELFTARQGRREVVREKLREFYFHAAAEAK